MASSGTTGRPQDLHGAQILSSTVGRGGGHVNCHRYIQGMFVKEEVGTGGHKEEGGQLRTPLLHCSFPNEMAKPCPVHWGCVWHESATSAIYCQLIKLAFVISQRGRAGLCKDRWRMKEIFMPFELFMAGNFTC